MSIFSKSEVYSWPLKKSYAFALEIPSGSQHIFGIKISFICFMLFMLAILVLFIAWVLTKFDESVWFKSILIIYLVLYGLFTTAGIKFYRTEFGLVEPINIMMGFALKYFAVICFVIHKYILHPGN